MHDHLESAAFALLDRANAARQEMRNRIAERNARLASLLTTPGGLSGALDGVLDSSSFGQADLCSLRNIVELDLGNRHWGQWIDTLLAASDLITADNDAIIAAARLLGACQPEHDGLSRLNDTTAIAPMMDPVVSWYTPLLRGEDTLRFAFLSSLETEASASLAEAEYIQAEYENLCSKAGKARTEITRRLEALAQALPVMTGIAERAAAEMEEALTNAENAMAQAIGCGNTYRIGLETLEATAGITATMPFRYGYRDQTGYVDWVVRPVLRRSLRFDDYRRALAAALAADDTAAAERLTAAFTQFQSDYALLRHRYSAALKHYSHYFGRAQTLGGPSPAFLTDWADAVAIPGRVLSVPNPPSSTRQFERYYALAGLGQPGFTDYSNPTQENWFNGLASVTDLPDPGFPESPVTDEHFEGEGDAEATAFHELGSLRNQWRDQDWNTLPPAEFESSHAAASAAVAALQPRLSSEEPTLADPAISAAVAALAQVYGAYADTHYRPTITQQPASTEVRIGSPAGLSISLSGDIAGLQWFSRPYQLPLDDYTWFDPIPGATGSTLEIAAVEGTRDYYAEITPLAGSPFRSAIARITARYPQPPWVMVQMADLTLPAGVPVRLFAMVMSQTSATLQWHRNGTPIPGATSEVLALGPMSIDVAGVYEAIATNEDGSGGSMPITLSLAEAGTTCGFSQWAQLRGLPPWEQVDPGVDSFGCGLPNLLAYAFGVDPQRGGDAGRRPVMERVDGTVGLTFRRPTYVTGVTMTGEYSTDLTHWSAIGCTLEKTGESEGVEHWRLTPPPLPPGTPAFLRLSAEPSP